MQLRRAVLLAAGVLVLSLGVASTSDGQGYRQRGITPIFDGWETLADGSRLIYFGYINRSSVEVVIPIGPSNTFDGSNSDRGQPTNFLPGRHEHIFTVKSPADPKTKMVWTVTSEMGKQTANASFDQLYILEERENEDPNAKPPAIKVADVVARVGEPVRLAPEVTPATSSGQVVVEGAAAEAAGLSIVWSKYRGAGAVSFSAVPGAEIKRPVARGRSAEGGSPPVGSFPIACGQKPAADCGAAMARFTEPGAYVLRAAARQDGLQGLAFVKVTVQP
jgi:hypothetical protein